MRAITTTMMMLSILDKDDHEEEDGHLPNLHPLLVQHNCCHSLLGLSLIAKQLISPRSSGSPGRQMSEGRS